MRKTAIAAFVLLMLASALAGCGGPSVVKIGVIAEITGSMPAVGKSEERGDLYATVNVALPKQLTPEQRTHYEELAKLDS